MLFDNPLLFENKAGMSTSSVGSEEDSEGDIDGFRYQETRLWE